VVAERAYHGHTASVIGVSPYKFQGIGGKGKPSHVQVMKCPDTYRDMVTLEEFKADCERCCQALGAVSCLLMESGMSKCLQTNWWLINNSVQASLVSFYHRQDI